MKPWHIVAAIMACLVTATIVSFPYLGPASDTGVPMDLRAGAIPARIQLAASRGCP